ncbi:hypothetical protein CC78DRAFT_132046 [Lojkania enalia]|uniref:Ankyrin n=1 Tax=Lojkania enalia TaxID=147567 RepID=A0A9P4NBW7_9PLEO|nr:hypothetical protein CC78DRAFT_132046 [Didymosphaeria enalia]
MIAIHFGNVAVAKLLIANGATVCYSPPDTNLTALHRCVRLAVAGSAKDSLEIMNALFAHGANANQMDRANETALHKLMIDAWFARHDEESMKKLYPIARCLVENGAILPTTINKKYVNGNPLWHIINSGEYVDEWPENVGTDHNMVLVGGGWVKKRDIVPRNNSSHGLGSER